MDYALYDKVQAELGMIADVYDKECKNIIYSACNDPVMRGALLDLTKATQSALNQLAGCISESLIASSK